MMNHRVKATLMLTHTIADRPLRLSLKRLKDEVTGVEQEAQRLGPRVLARKLWTAITNMAQQALCVGIKEEDVELRWCITARSKRLDHLIIFSALLELEMLRGAIAIHEQTELPTACNKARALRPRNWFEPR